MSRYSFWWLRFTCVHVCVFARFCLTGQVSSTVSFFVFRCVIVSIVFRINLLYRKIRLRNDRVYRELVVKFYILTQIECIVYERSMKDCMKLLHPSENVFANMSIEMF